MLSEKETGLLYETLLSAPGMNDTIKLDLRISRKDILLLAKVIAKGLGTDPGDTLTGLLKAAGSGSKDSLDQVSEDLMEKAGLTDMNQKLMSLQPPGK